MFEQLLASEFAWGVLLGVVLSAFGAFLGHHLQRNQHRKNVELLFRDLITNIQEYASALEEHRDLNGVIHLDFLSLMEIEVTVWGRNREHMVLLPNSAVRTKLRQYFSGVSTNIARVRFQLTQWDNLYRAALEIDDQASKQQLGAAAQSHLDEAHVLCAKLATHVQSVDASATISSRQIERHHK